MKNLLLKPGFEVIFSLSLIAILALPPVLMAQNAKDVDINIVNGDTTVNGKNIKQLSAADRQEALKDINRAARQPAGSDGVNFTFKRKDSLGGGMRRMEFKRRKMGMDSGANMADMRPRQFGQMEQNFALRQRGGDDNVTEFRGRVFNPARMRGERKNSQNFDYENTNNEGISTHVHFHVAEIPNEDLKKMPHVEGGLFEISDLNLVPEFSTGKTLLMFKLPAKTVASVKLTDSQGKLLFEEKAAGGMFNKNVVLGLNGIYHLQVKQGNNIAIKKIIKQE